MGDFGDWYKTAKHAKFGHFHFPVQSTASDYNAQAMKKVPLLGPPPEVAKANAADAEAKAFADYDAQLAAIKKQAYYSDGDAFDYKVANMYTNRNLGYFDTKPSRDSIRTSTLRKLWEDVIKSVHVRHPDPKARIRLMVTDAYSGAVRGKFHILARDTREDPNGHFDADASRGFTMPFTVSMWPGAEIAKLYIVGAWMLYLAHEATELISDNDKLNRARSSAHETYHGKYLFPDGGRVFNVHDQIDGPEKLMVTDHWQRMHAVMVNDPRGGGGLGPRFPARPEHPIELTISNLVGPTVAKDMWEKAKPIYAAELERLTDEAYAAAK